MTTGVVVRGMWGLGDNIFQRPFVRALARQRTVYLETPWPELYADIPGVRFLYAERQLRTQMRNVARQPFERWSWPVNKLPFFRVSYGDDMLLRGLNVWQAMQRHFGVEPEGPFDLPDVGTWRGILHDRQPIALIRPVTLRREWQNSARNPRWQHVDEATATLRELGFYTIAVADLKEGHEWADGKLPDVHEAYLGGELTTWQMLALARASSVICGGVGWIVPASIALGVPAFVLLGGNGASNAPDKITDSRMDLSKIEFASPENFCRCSTMSHKCKDKLIKDVPAKLRGFLKRVDLHSSTNSRAVA